MTREDFRSDEEHVFYLWLLEAQLFGYVNAITYEHTTYVIHQDVLVDKKEFMKTKVKQLTGVPLFENAQHGAIRYTPDFGFTLTEKGVCYWKDNIFWRQLQFNQPPMNLIQVDVKGKFNPHGGTKAFFLKQRMMWDMHGIYVSKVEPTAFFKRCWAPESARWCKGRRVPTLTKLGRSTVDCPTYTQKFAWRMEAAQPTLGELL